MSIFVILGLLVCIIEAQGSSAVNPSFVQKGGDVLLTVDADVPEDFLLVGWRFNNTIFIAIFSPGRKPVTDVYTGRVEFPEEKYSVKLKNLQEADSGVYTARVLGAKDQTLAEYTVIVQGSDSPSAGISVCLVKTVVYSVGLIIMVSAIITVNLMEKLKRHK